MKRLKATGLVVAAVGACVVAAVAVTEAAAVATGIASRATAATTVQASQPDGATVLDRHVAAAGGTEAFARLRTRVTKARLEIPAAGVSMAVTVWAARPDRMRTLVESELVGRIERGYDGAVAWELTTTAGPRVHDGAQLDDLARDSRFDGLAGWRDWVAKAECLGAADVEGKPAWKVRITPKRGSPQTFYFDQASSLAVRMETIVPTPMGEVPAEAVFGEYREVDGVRIPHRVRQQAAGQDLVTVVESVTHNTEMAEAEFALPKEVQALVAKK